MNEKNYVFFEEYKQLDKLCRDMYPDKGVTGYIDDMVNTYWHDYPIKNWESDLTQLKKMRKLRNRLAHTEGAFTEDICTQMDIQFVQNFHKRIIDGTDPLAMKQQYCEKRHNMQNDVSDDSIFKENQSYHSTSQKENIIWIIMISLVAIAFSIFMIWVMIG